MKKRIGEVCEDFLNETGVFVTDEKVRRYEEMNLFSSTRGKENDFREYSDEEQAKVRKVLMLIELGVKFDDILANNVEAFDKRLKSVHYILDQLRSMKLKKEG